LSSILMIVTAATLPLGGDFVRGDSNSDGRVSIADVYAGLAYLFWEESPVPECQAATDANDNGDHDITDAAFMLSYLNLGTSPPPPPFPLPGPDPTPDGLPCESYGNGSPLSDPAARLEVLPGSTSGEDGLATVTIALSSSAPLGGYAGSIRLPPGAVQDVKRAVRDLQPPDSDGKMGGVVFGQDVIRFSRVLLQGESITAGSSIPVVEITLCLAGGLSAGDYPLELEAGELVDYATARAIAPALGSSTLTVATAVTGQAECNPPPPEPIPVNAAFKLQDAIAPPGGEVTIPFVMRADAPIQGYTFAVDFDETVLEAKSIEKVWQKPAGTDPEYTFGKTIFNNRDDLPGSSGLAEGYLIGAIIFDIEELVYMPADTDNLALRFHMKVKDAAPDVSTELRFLEHVPPTGQQMRNFIWALGETASPETAESFLLVDCLLQILPDGAVFVRGDSNTDDRVDVSDAVNTLGHLFLGAGPLFCTDAADANDDGALDISDPIATLEYLFGGTVPALPEPHGAPGSDPTPDSLYCYSRP